MCMKNKKDYMDEKQKGLQWMKNKRTIVDEKQKDYVVEKQKDYSG